MPEAPNAQNTALKVSAALVSLKESMMLDGYDLTVSTSASGLMVEVSAGPQACADCLVPKSIFHALVTQAIRSADSTLAVPGFGIAYPADSHAD